MPVKPIIDQVSLDHLQSAVQNELFASNLYKHVANHMRRLGYFGAQKFFETEAEHENVHYTILANFLDEVGSVAVVPAIPAITDQVSGLHDAIQIAYDTELQLLKDYTRAYEQSDVVTKQFLLQFIEIQRKAVGEFGDLTARLEICGTDKAALLKFDTELGQ